MRTSIKVIYGTNCKTRPVGSWPDRSGWSQPCACRIPVKKYLYYPLLEPNLQRIHSPCGLVATIIKLWRLWHAIDRTLFRSDRVSYSYVEVCSYQIKLDEKLYVGSHLNVNINIAIYWKVWREQQHCSKGIVSNGTMIVTTWGLLYI